MPQLAVAATLYLITLFPIFKGEADIRRSSHVYF